LTHRHSPAQERNHVRSHPRAEAVLVRRVGTDHIEQRGDEVVVRHRDLERPRAEFITQHTLPALSMHVEMSRGVVRGRGKVDTHNLDKKKKKK
jgi:hypothetical protein